MQLGLGVLQETLTLVVGRKEAGEGEGVRR